MAKLEEKHKIFIVEALARYDTPSQVSRAVKEEFGIDVAKEQVQQYNPERAACLGIAKKLRAIFERTRKKFIEDVSDVPISRQAYRLRRLQMLHDLAVTRSNASLAAQLLEQAAKEIGGAFTNTRQLQGPGGGPIPVGHSGEVKHLHQVTDADLEAIIAGDTSRGA